MNKSTLDLSKIPSDWEIIPCGYFFKEKSIKNNFGEINLSVYRDYGVIPRDSRDDNHNRVSEDISNYKLVEKGDFVLNKMKCWMGSLGVSNHRGIVSPSYTVLQPKRLINNRYFHYLLRSEEYRQIYESLSYGVRVSQWELRFNDFKVIPALYPKIEEQKLISNYLDKKTHQINQLIDITNKKVELLKEYKSALINKYVIKGLNPIFNLKDSGVKWIGEIPNNWRVLKFKHITELITCGHASTPEYVDDGIMFLSAQNVKNGSLDLSKFRKIKHELHSQLSRRNKITKGDLLQVRVGATIGETCIVDISDNFSIYVSLSLIKLNNIVHNNYIKFLCNCSRFREFSRIEMKQGGGVPNLNVSDLERYKIPVPPKSEQEEISKFLQEKTDKIDEIIKKLNIKKSHLNEYRQSLISYVVTGKIRITEDML